MFFASQKGSAQKKMFSVFKSSWDIHTLHKLKISRRFSVCPIILCGHKFVICYYIFYVMCFGDIISILCMSVNYSLSIQPLNMVSKFVNILAGQVRPVPKFMDGSSHGWLIFMSVVHLADPSIILCVLTQECRIN